MNRFGKKLCLASGLFFAAVPNEGLAATNAECLKQYADRVDTGSLEKKAATDLTAAEARDLIIHLYQRGDISFPPKQGFEPLFSADCTKVRSPFQLANPGSGTSQRLSIMANVAGVRFIRYLYKANRTGTAPKDFFVEQRLDNLQPRMVVALYFLAIHLKETYGVDEIYTAGIGTKDSGDHVPGIAIDFVGVHGTGITTTDHKLFVEDDWYKHPVPGPGGKQLPNWPTNEQKTSYRLDFQPKADSNAREFFRDMYNFFAYQFAGCPDSPIGPKCEGDRLKHPDYFMALPGSAYGRDGHYNHIHAGMTEVGK